ncbi:MAG: HAD family hydrolase [Spirochaetales bacterium]|nr:HAD family hydrolase [Spirochaetales bacterium]
MAIRAVGFDIDGTLYPASAIYLRLFWHGIRRMKLLSAFNEVRHELRRLSRSPEYRQRGIVGIAAFHRHQAELTATKLGDDPQRVHDAIEDFFYGSSTEVFASIKPFADVAPLLDSLRTRGYRLGALSDFPCERKLELLGLSDKFDVAMTSEETGLVKPDRASFDLLAQRLGVPNEEILYVGNSESYDVAGSKAAGMRSALISRKRHIQTAADFVFYHWPDLERYILDNS